MLKEMNTTPKFSVITSVYKNDNPEFIKTAFDSIYGEQSLSPDEIIVVVDGPVSEEIEQVVSSYELGNPNLFKIIRLSENRGLGNALKVGLNSATYDIVARMDSDDYSVPDRFKKQIMFLINHPDIDIIGGNIYEFIGDRDNIVGSRQVPCNHKDISRYLQSRCPFNHMTVMFRKQSVELAGGYLDWHYNEDYYLWIRMALNKCRFANLSDVLVYARVGAEMYARRGGWKYFKSEASLQKYMYNQGVISIFKFCSNVLIRFILQVCLPNRLRGFMFKHFARKRVC